MCGRYQLDYELDPMLYYYDAINRLEEYEAYKEVFPTNIVPIVVKENGHNYLEAAKWGFDNPFDTRPLINARGETVDEKKTFKTMFTNTRCIIPASAFFEWRKSLDGKKKKTRISVNDMPLFSMAGLYSTFLDSDGTRIRKCAIITTSANEAMSSIHDRMPVILYKDSSELWLNNEVQDLLLLKDLLKPYTGELTFE